MSGTTDGGPRVGDELTPLTIPITRTLIVAGAIASRDYQDVHHDAELAREKGSPDVFMNILTTNGLVGRFVTDHFGPLAVLRAVAIRLGVPNYPGDTMTLTGTVTDVDEECARVRITGANGLGHHVTGTVTVSVPAAATPSRDPAATAEGPAQGATRAGRDPEQEVRA
ncbi:MaoC family dehydratase [Streptomyces sp. NPDC059176]|uniref:MaoC family dehydratase n=1 Tax=unclassified Streptomyces TaxID=2593676 RepID=UPI0036C0ACC9